MPRLCTVCIHPKREEIDRALVSAEPYRGIARKYAVGEDALARHHKTHVAAELAIATEAQEVAAGTTDKPRVERY